MKDSTKAILLLLIIGIAYFGYTKGWFSGLVPGQQVPTAPSQPTTPTTGGWEGGTFTVYVKGRNSLDSSSALTAGTNFNTGIYAYRNGHWVFLGSDTGSGVNIEATREDNGYVWVLVEEKSGQYYYVDVPTTLQMNSRVSEYRWTDADGDNQKEFLFKLSLLDVPKPASGYPQVTFYPYFLAESGQGTPANALQWETQPSDIVAGTTANKKNYIGWAAKLTASKRAVGVYKIEVRINSTDTSKFKLDKVNIPGVGYIDGSQFEETILSSETRYVYKIGSDFNDIVYWKIPEGTNNKIDLTVCVETSLSSSDVIQVTLYVYQMLYDRSTTYDSDSVCLKGS